MFTLQRQGVEPQRYRLTVFFNGRRLERFDGDEMPSETEFVAIGREASCKVPVLEATEDSSSQIPRPPRPACTPPPPTPSPA